MPSSAPESLHILIADAVLSLPAGSKHPPWPELPRLQSLLRRMQLTDSIEIEDDCPATPCEIVLARAQGLPDTPGRIPWAAFETGTVGTPCAWLQPCHWQFGMDDVSVVNPDEMNLSEDESRALLAAVQPLVAEDGLVLRYVRPDAWLATGDLLLDLTTWSMRRASQGPLGREVLSLSTDTAQSVHLKRLQSEIQMLLYTHPVNDAREQRGRWPINAMWISGAGVLDKPLAARTPVVVERRLQSLPTRFGAAELASIWHAIEADITPRLQAVLRASGQAQLSLCGPRRALTWRSTQGLWQRLSGRLRPMRLAQLQERL